MREENVKVIIWGFGSMGSGMAKMLLKKQGVEIVGVVDGWDQLAGKEMHEVLKVEKTNHPEVKITLDTEKESIIKPGAADVVLLATDSFTAKAFDKMKFILENKINVITTAEEMAYPQAQEPELAKQLDEIAKANGVSVLGTGINPGLIMDLLVLTLTGACEDVEHIVAKRVNSLSPFGRAVMEEQGVGLEPGEFDRLVESGELAGHVGFEESVGVIAEGIGWELDEPVRTSMDSIVSSVDRHAPYAEVAAGNVAGVNMLGWGKVDGEDKIEMIHPQQVEPEDEGVHTGDYIEITGEPNISMAITPEVPGGIGTIAMCVNSIPNVINGEAGLLTMLDVPVPMAIMGDMRKRIK
ncbi:NADP-binding protein [Peptoniphilus sp. KCTC 25270]|uniref:2,4-diaminopentanoate dehydrogenase n=1 Tax=Peptoniphilus sp. KCTC 25270 TaxID=2897414 RepID=UPI001E53FC2A|nr:2,4-diaminopentanoate dehydrogenase [Peptoniphilus sp. KCTC 25270]MCD1147809.1 NADP-binding protein [Peptoniphilus sp. KCTC 25270]